MARHIIDHPRKRSTSGMKVAFSRIEAKKMPRRETLILQRRPLETGSGALMREFARIEKELSA